MDTLWAPWRSNYISAKPPGGCFLCHAAVSDDDTRVVERTAHSLVVLNRYPYNNGHLLMAPLAHVAEPADLSDEQTLDLQRLIAKYCERMRKRMNAEGFNVGLNLGKAAGAGLPGHLHWHVVPRWTGDSNFMPVTGDSRIISQSLDALYELLTATG